MAETTFYPIYDSGDGVRPGLCVIISQDVFDEAENLPGHRVDVASLCNTFLHFGFNVRAYFNLSAEGLLTTLKELDDGSTFRGYASLVVCILSHGDCEYVYGTDGMYVGLETLHSITDSVEDLKGKPKLYIVQTHDMIKGHKNNLVPRPREEMKPGTRERVAIVDLSPKYPDLVQLMCTEFVFPNSGSSFVQGYCYHLRLGGKNRRILRDVYDAYNQLRQEIAKEKLMTGKILASGPNYLYLSNLGSNMKLGFKTVETTERLEKITFFDIRQDVVDYVVKNLSTAYDCVFKKTKYSTVHGFQVARWKKVGEIEMDETVSIGHGIYYSVCIGKYLGNDVAVKRVWEGQIDKDGLEKMLNMAPHSNVVRCLHSGCDSVFRYLALELCACTLGDILPGRFFRGRPIAIDDQEILLQMTSGLHYLHRNETAHRDLKPTNVLFNSRLDVVKLSDFGIFPRNGHAKGETGWIAPEMYDSDRSSVQEAKLGDVWSLGCLFAFTLFDGKHPFGEFKAVQKQNIRARKAMHSSFRDLLDKKGALAIVESMTHPDPDKRKTTRDLMEDEYFKCAE